MGIFSSVQIALGHPSVDDKSLQMKEIQITGNKLWIIEIGKGSEWLSSWFYGNSLILKLAVLSLKRMQDKVDDNLKTIAELICQVEKLRCKTKFLELQIIDIEYAISRMVESPFNNISLSWIPIQN